MKALIYDPDLTVGEAPEPSPSHSQALVQVRAVALNFGEIAYRPERPTPGYVPGWDAAEIVLRPAADGTGPAAGTRVTTFGWGGAWAERRAVDVGGSQLAEAFLQLEDDGVVQAIGKASREPTVIDFELARERSARGRIENFNISTPLGDDLTRLVSLLAAGALDLQVGWRGSWERAGEAAAALLGRRVPGKAVLDLA